MTKNLRAFEITYISPTNTKGSRVKIRDLRFEKTKIIPYDYELNHIGEMAIVYLNGQGINCLFKCESKNGYIVLTDDFETQIREVSQ